MDHGLDLSNVSLQRWMIGIPVVHIALVITFRVTDICPEMTRKGCRGSDIIAFEIVSGLCVLWCSIAGSLGFFNLFDLVENKDLFLEKFSAQSDYVSNNIILPMFCYQVYNIFVCLIHNEMRTFDSIAHHVVTSCLAYFGLYPFAQYYALFYFGIAELTTLPLNVMETFKYLPGLAKDHSDMYSLSRLVFASSFFLIRLIFWPMVSFELWFGCQDLLRSNQAHSNFVVGFFLFANLFLTGLQFYWGYLIIRKAISPRGGSGGGVVVNDDNNNHKKR
jgi:hypothetical protein